MSSHPIVHIELSANDLKAAEEFYAHLFGWKIQQIPEFNYATFVAEGGPGGGFNPVSENYQAGWVIPYVASDDIEADLAKAESLGARTLMPKQEIPGTGWIAMFEDPTGNKVGLYTVLRTET